MKTTTEDDAGKERVARSLWLAAGLEPEGYSSMLGLRRVIDRIAAAAVRLAHDHASETTVTHRGAPFTVDIDIEAAAKRAVEGRPS